MNGGPLEHVPKSGREFVGQTWLQEETGTALTLGALSYARRSIAGEQDDRNLSRSRLALQVVNQLPSVAAAPESRLRWFRCRQCGHLWSITPPASPLP